MNATPRVLNIKQCGYVVPPGAVYIGRKNSRYRLPESKWANPFKPLRNTREKHERVIAEYERHLRESGLIVEAHQLRGLKLVCWCAPLPCHGDVLLRLANAPSNTPHAAGTQSPQARGDQKRVGRAFDDCRRRGAGRPPPAPSARTACPVSSTCSAARERSQFPRRPRFTAGRSLT